MSLRNRVIELRRVPAAELRANPRNWRTHPPGQRSALQGILSEIGFAGALIARELEHGALELVDGHLRAETAAPDDVLPVLVLDLNESEADTLLAVLDPIAGMATRDDDLLAALLERVETEDRQVQALLDQIRQGESSIAGLQSQGQTSSDSVPSLRIVPVPESFQLLVDCRDEDDQRELDARLTEEGYKCRVLTL
ncbi:MAG: hypothetical protein MPJ50_00180 [Pirellulales bacterium]|nr:hypothetical protein [Pirellulales bacterium]